MMEYGPGFIRAICIVFIVGKRGNGPEFILRRRERLPERRITNQISDAEAAVPLGLWPSCVLLVLALRQDAIGGLGDGADKLSLTVWPADATSRARAGRRRTAAARWPTQAARRSRQLRRLQEQRPGRRGDRKRRSSVRLLAGEAEYVAGEADCDSLVLLAHDPKLVLQIFVHVFREIATQGASLG